MSGKELPSSKVIEEEHAETKEVLEHKQKEIEKVVPKMMVFVDNPPMLNLLLHFPQRF